MWLRHDNLMLWSNVVTEAYCLKGISESELELWAEYSGKYAKLLHYRNKLSDLKHDTWHLDEEYKRMSNEVNIMEEDVEKVRRKAMSTLLGFTYPSNENAVIYAFGRLYKWLGPILARALIDENSFDKFNFRIYYPDAEIVKGNTKIRIEFETNSRNFKTHLHDEQMCELIICWIHDWDKCPLKVLDLKNLTLYEPK